MTARIVRGIGLLALGAALARPAGAVEVAGTLYVELNTATLSGLGNGAAVTTWSNTAPGSLGDYTNGPASAPVYTYDLGGVPAVLFNQAAVTNYLRGGNTVADVTGAGDWTVELWVFNPGILGEECVFNWARRGENFRVAQVNYGNNAGFGAVTHWTAAGDMGFDLGVPPAGQWHHLAVTYNGTTERVYVDGGLCSVENKALNIRTGDPLVLGAALDATLANIQLPFSGGLAQVRLHGGALTHAQVVSNYFSDRAYFSQAATPGGFWTAGGTNSWTEPSSWELGNVPSLLPAIVTNGAVVWLTNAAPAVTHGIFSNGTLWTQGGSVQSTLATYIGLGPGMTASLVMDGGAITNTGGNFRFGENGAAGYGTINSNSTLYLPAGELWMGQSVVVGSMGIVTNNGGTINVANNWIGVGRQGAYGRYVQRDGAMIKNGGGNLIIGSLGGTGDVTLAGGTISINSLVALGESSGNNLTNGMGTFNLDGGTLTAQGATRFAVTATRSTTGILNFNGGTLRANQNNVNFVTNLTAANVLAGGAVFDSAGFDVTVGQDLLDGGGGGGLVKNGGGTLTLMGTNAYAGLTTVNGGTLVFGLPESLPAASPPVLVTSGGAAGWLGDIDQTFLAKIDPASSGAVVLTQDSFNNFDFSAASLTNARLGTSSNAAFYGTFQPYGNVYRLGGGGGILTFTPFISGASQVIVGGGGVTGTVALTSFNSYTNGTYVLPGGTLAISDWSNIGAAGSPLFMQGGVLRVTGFGITDFNPITLNETTFDGGIDMSDPAMVMIVYNALSGPGSLSKLGPGRLVLSGDNSYAGPTRIQGGTLQVGGGGTTGSLGAGAVSFSAAMDTLAFNRADNVLFDRPISSLNLGVLEQSSFGTLTVATPAPLYRFYARQGTTIVSNAPMTAANYLSIAQNGGENGTVWVVGSGRLASTGDFNVSDLAGSVGVLHVSNTASIASGNMYIGKTGPSTVGILRLADSATMTCAVLSVGCYLDSFGLVHQSGGSVFSATAGGEWRIGGAGSTADAASYGAYRLDGGVLTNGRNWQVGAYGLGLYEQHGGVNVQGDWPVFGRFGGGRGVGYIDGGSFWQTNVPRRLIVGEQGRAELTLAGDAAVDLAGGLRIGMDYGGLPGTGQVNLAGGTLTTPLVETSGGVSLLFLNGGLLRAGASTANFMSGLTAAVVEQGGADIDTAGQTVTIAQALAAPVNYGVTNIVLDNGGSGYLAPPLVFINGDGTGATALAQIDVNGVVTNILVTNPGHGYTTTPSIELVGGKGGGASIWNIELAPAESGGLRKDGAGVLTLAGVNTYTGATVVAAGTLLVTGAIDTGAVTVASGATLGGTGTVGGAVTGDGHVSPGASVGLLTVGGFAPSSSGALDIELGGPVPGTEHDQLVVNGPATLAGTLTVTLTNGFAPAAGQSFTVLTASAVSGAFATNNLPAVSGLTWSVTNTGSAVVLSAVAGGTPYDTWATLYGLTPGGGAGDADADGSPDLFEYSQLSNPTNSASKGLPGGSQTGGVLRLVFQRNTSATDITYIVEASNGVTNGAPWLNINSNFHATGWSDPARVTETGAGEARTVTVYDTETAATNRFMRLRVAKP